MSTVCYRKAVDQSTRPTQPLIHQANRNVQTAIKCLLSATERLQISLPNIHSLSSIRRTEMSSQQLDVYCLLQKGCRSVYQANSAFNPLGEQKCVDSNQTSTVCYRKAVDQPTRHTQPFIHSVYCLTRGTYGRGSYIGLWDAPPILAADFSVKPVQTACCWSI